MAHEHQRQARGEGVPALSSNERYARTRNRKTANFCRERHSHTRCLVDKLRYDGCVRRHLILLALVLHGGIAACGLSTLGTGPDAVDAVDGAADGRSGGPSGADGSVSTQDGGPEGGDGGGVVDGSSDGTTKPADSGIGCTVGATATSLCDNFDDPFTGWASFWTLQNPAMSLVSQDVTTSVSAPKSLYAGAPMNTPDPYEVGLKKQMAFGKTVTVDFDYEVIATGGYVEVVQIMFGGTDNARFLVNTSDTIAYVDGYNGTSRRGVGAGVATLGGWHHAHVVFTFASAGGGASITLDHGATLPSNVGDTVGTAPATFDVHVGNSPGMGQAASRANVDNFVLTVTP